MRYFLLLASLLYPFVEGNNDNSKVTVINDSGEIVRFSWINPSTDERVFLADLPDGKEQPVNSFIGHEFEFSQTGDCEQFNTCLASRLIVTESPAQSFYLNEHFEVLTSDSLVAEERQWQPSQRLSKCNEWAKRQLKFSANNQNDSLTKIMNEFNDCLTQGLSRDINRKTQEIHFEKEIRETLSHEMENFTCTNPDLETTPDVATREWTSSKDNKTRLVHVKLDRPASRIHVIEDFVYPEECDAMEKSAAGRLRRASTADGKGGTQVSENRKAMQAAITPQWSLEDQGDLVARLSRRVYDYVNDELQMNITEHGQEPLMSIQYFGRGYNDSQPDRYTPHCDGSCDGRAHKFGTRVATVVVYCTIPEKGGSTNFQNANVHVKPRVGNGIFFSYIDPQTHLMDNVLTQHSGCPVYEGEKKIITQWIRYGVSEKTSHDDFNTLGILYSESGD